VGGSAQDILANDNAKGQAVVAIADTDYAFQSQDCGVWSLDLGNGPPRDSVTHGTFIVGKDIKAGTYRTDGGSGCYWVRLAGFGGGIDDIIANDNVKGPTVVEVAPGDVGFKSQDCGTWRLAS
jgi:hypothetical protein